MSRPDRLGIALLSGMASMLLVTGVGRADSITYVNDRFGTSIAFPIELFDSREELPANGDGVVFTSRTGASLAVFGQYNAMELTPQTMEDFLRHGIDERSTVTYRRVGDNWTVLSGTYPGMIFYERREFGPSGIIHGFSLNYPQAVHSVYDPAVAAIAESLTGP